MNGPGDFINQNEAINELNAFFKMRESQKGQGIPWDPKSSPYAYQFGIEQMQQLMSKIAAWDSANPDNKIGGIRVFSAVTNGAGESGTDVFLIPYLANDGKDYIPVDKYFDNNGSEITEISDDDTMILGEGKRCPPKCQ